MKKIIIIKLFFFLNFSTSKKIIEIKNLNEIENTLTKELKINKEDKNTIILLDSRLIFYYEKSDYKKFEKKEDYSKKHHEKNLFLYPFFSF